MRRHFLRTLLLLLPCACAIPRGAAPDSFLRDREIQTVIREDRFTVFSQAGPLRTATICQWIAEEMSDLTELFGAALQQRQLIFLVVDRRYTILQLNGRPTLDFLLDRGFEAYATSAGNIQFAVDPVLRAAPDAEPIIIRGEDYQRSVMRHELAHQFMREIVGEQPTWLSEGLADWIQTSSSPAELRAADIKRLFFPPKPGSGGLPVSLRAPLARDGKIQNAFQLLPEPSEIPAADLPPLQDLLKWQEKGMRIISGEDWPNAAHRLAAACFVAFLLSRDDPDQPFHERILRMTKKSESELLPLEEDFLSWYENWRISFLDD